MFDYKNNGNDLKEDVYYENPDIIDDKPSDTPYGDESAGENKYADDSDGEHYFAFYESDDERKRYADKLIKEAREKNVRATLVLSLIGLFFSLIFGMGIVFSILALIRANFGLKKCKSQSLVWARALAWLGIILSGAFIVTMVLFFGSGFYYYALPEVVS